MDDNPWIKCSIELPPEDGRYECLCSNSIFSNHYYNGYGFLRNENGYTYFVYPEFWRFEKKPTKKLYGWQIAMEDGK